MIYIIITIIVLSSLAFSVYINARLFAYIKGLELITQENITKTENLHQSMREVIQDEYLLNDGRLKKFRFQKDNVKIYNGINVIDQEVTL